MQRDEIEMMTYLRGEIHDLLPSGKGRKASGRNKQHTLSAYLNGMPAHKRPSAQDAGGGSYGIAWRAGKLQRRQLSRV